MTRLTTITLAVLPLLSLIAVPPLLIAPQRNGLMELLQGDDAEISFFTVMVRFTLPILKPGNLSLSVQAIHFFAMWMSSWILIFVESFRPGPQDSSKVRVWAFGLAIECVGAGIVLPLWCLFNILYSYKPVGSGRNSAGPSSALIKSPDLKMLWWSLVIGAGIPALIMLICPIQAPVTLLSKETWIIIRLFHPFTTGLISWALRKAVFVENNGDRTPAKTSESLDGLRQIYRVAFWMSALSHCLIVLSIGTVYMFPSYFDHKIVDALSVRSIWHVSSPWQNRPSKLKTSEPGISTFLFWDEATSAFALVLWALTVNRVSLEKVTHRQTWQLVLKTVILTLVFGPSAAAVSLVQEKDEKLAQARGRVKPKA